MDKFGDKVPEYVAILCSRISPNMQAEDVRYIFSSVHKFKGLECDTVRLLDDFFFENLPRDRPGMGRSDGGVGDGYKLPYVAG